MQASVATPGASRRIRLLLLVALAFVAGLLLQDALSERLAEIVARAEHDRLAARAELATWLRGVIGTACGLTAAFGLAIAVGDAQPLVRQHAHWCTQAHGGRGAAREVCELIMDAQGHLERLLAAYR